MFDDEQENLHEVALGTSRHLAASLKIGSNRRELVVEQARGVPARRPARRRRRRGALDRPGCCRLGVLEELLQNTLGSRIRIST